MLLDFSGLHHPKRQEWLPRCARHGAPSHDHVLPSSRIQVAGRRAAQQQLCTTMLSAALSMQDERACLEEAGSACEVSGQRDFDARVAQAFSQAARHQHKCRLPASLHTCAESQGPVTHKASTTCIL